MDKYSYISNSDINYIDDLYNKYKSDPKTVDHSWRKFFEGFDFSVNNKLFETSNSELLVGKLIHTYRLFGHLNSLTNPVRERRNHNVSFDIKSFGLKEVGSGGVLNSNGLMNRHCLETSLENLS